MGIQSLQDYVDSSSTYSMQLAKYLEVSKLITSNLVLVHADSCLRQFYHENIDWVCGGQWSELFQCVDKFVRAFRQSDIELIVFFDGSISEMTLHHWSRKHGHTRETVRETLSHVIHNQSIPFRTKTRNFVAPGAFRSALRLAFRACDVTVCCSLKDIYKESILYAKDVICLGILGNDSNYFLNHAPRYMSLGSTRWLKKTLSACKIFNTDKLLADLCLTDEDLPYFAALLGNFVINDKLLSGFYWDLIEDDSPLKKVKENLSSDAVLPPSELRLKCVAKFICEHRTEIQDLENLAKLVFGNSSNISVEEGYEKLQKVLSFYQESLKATKSSVCTENDELNQLSLSGFPLPSAISTLTGCQNRYKKKWDYLERTKQVTQSAVDLPGENDSKTENLAKIEDPEQVLKQGTLEEAAQALEQLEMKETAAETMDKTNDGAPTEQSEEKPPSTTAVEREQKQKDETDVESPPTESQEPVIEYPREISISGVDHTISDDVINVARKRHQCGQMCPEILNILTKGEVILNMSIDDELVSSRLPIPLIYRPLRQLVYGVLYGVKQNKERAMEDEIQNSEDVIEKSSDENEAALLEEKEEPVKEKQKTNSDSVKEDNDEVIPIKEWCVYGERDLDQPDLVNAKGMTWGVPPLKKLWFGTDSEDNANRLKAFLSCMKSDTVNMSNTAMVPQRLMLLCCVLRYLVQQDKGKSILTKQDIDAFLAQALSAHLTTEHNTQNLANLKLNQVDARCVQLASIFMNGIENAIIANDACGSPVPWEFCCPWNFFDGKLFHTKWLQATMNFSPADLSEGKPHIAEKLERLRWCITEGLEAKYTIAGLQESKKFLNPFGNVPSPLQSRPMYGVLRPDGAYPPSYRQRSRGPNSKRTVHGSGGTLHVAGVPVAHWGGNKAGVGYTKNGPGVVVGGPNSIDLPSSHRRNRGGRGGRANRGRGLLETPFLSPWPQGFTYEDFMGNTYDRYLKGASNVEQIRPRGAKVNRVHVYTNRNRQQNPIGKPPDAGKENMWLGKGRGQVTTPVSPVKTLVNNEQRFGRGQWLSASE